MARKDFKQTYNVWGLEAPRNSMEQPVEASYCAVGDNIPYSYEVRYERPQKACTTEASMKKLINEEISQQPKPKQSSPNVVARLMGMDTLPLEEFISLQPEKKYITRHHTDVEKNKKGIGSRSHFKFSSLGNEEFDTFHHENIASFSSHIHTKEKKPKPREHPQEEELQKFKKEFQAWQAIRFKECSKVADLDTISDQVLAQETLNKEKANLYANSARISMNEKPRELGDQASNGTTHEKGNSKYQICSLSKRSPSEDFDQYSSPARIVVLMPGPERMTDNDDSRASSSGFSEERGGLEDFLEEVKERLKCELQGKIKKESVVRGGGIETRYSEKVSAPKQIAQRIAKHVRESVSRDLGMNLLRSESTRSYRSEIDRFNGSSSPEYINRGTRRILVERMRNVLKGETNRNYPKASYGCSDSSLECNEKEITEEVGMQTKSFRYGFDDVNTVHRELPPTSLMRSLSAPISRASFGKLLLEDRHVLTGAHIRRKHEAIESVTGGSKKRKKEKSKFKERVSSIRYSFTLKGKLFGRKLPLEKPQNCEYNTLRDIRMGPTVMMNYTYRNENCTEVPPSPASVCSSVQDDFWRETDHLSSTMSDISPLEDTTRVFREISSNLSNLQRQLKELDGGDTKEETEEHTHLAEMKFEDDAQAYIRDLIVASDIHKSSSDIVLSRWDPLAKPISNQIFEEVEESYDKRVKDNDDSTQQKLDHKLLYGLLNEAISVVLGPPMIMSRFRKEIAGITQPPRGKKLLDCVWKIVSGHLYSSSDKGHLSLDSMLARDFEFTPWPCKLNSDEIEFMGKEIETQITGYLIQELVKDISSL